MLGSAPQTPPREFDETERAVLGRYFTNLDGSVFALRNLPEVVKGALFSRYSRTEKSLRRVLLDEFIQAPETGFGSLIGSGPTGDDDILATRRAEEFYDRVLVGYGDDSVAELAGAHLAVERVSTLAAKALQDSRIGLSPLEKSTRYVRFDRPDAGGRWLYHRGPELQHPVYEPAMDALFRTYSDLIEPLTARVRERHPLLPDESERAWKTATRAKALDLLRGLLPAATFTNLGLFGNGRAFEYLVTKMKAHELPECRRLADDMHEQLSVVIPSFVRRALDDRYGLPAAERLTRSAMAVRELAPAAAVSPDGPCVHLVDYDWNAERKVVAAALFPHSNLPLADLGTADVDQVLHALMAGRSNRRHKAPRALEHAEYTFEVVANFACYRDLQRHRMLTQDRQVLGTELGCDLPPDLREYGFDGVVEAALDHAGSAHRMLERARGPVVAQYSVPLAFRLRWYMKASLREIYHLCELRTTPQGHPDYRFVAQEMFQRVREVHPRLAEYARFVDMGPGDELERRASEQRIDAKLRALEVG